MDPREFPTKGNLMLAKNSLALAHQGYDLMDKKRNILLKELMALIDEARIYRRRSTRHLRKHTHVFRGRISNMESVKLKNLHLQFRLKIRFEFRQEVLWERRFHM